MCDKAAFNKLREEITDLKRDHDDLKKEHEVHDARSEERFKTIFGIIKWIVSFILLMTLILLLTVVYGAVGERGFHAVTDSAHQIASRGSSE